MVLTFFLNTLILILMFKLGSFNQISYHENNPVPPRLMPYIGNGYIAWQIDNDFIYINGIYNGKAEAEEHVSHRAEFPGIFSDVIYQENYEILDRILHLHQGYYKRIIRLPTFIVDEYYYVHRKYENLVVFEVDKSESNSPKGECCLLLNFTLKSEDFDFTFVEDVNEDYMLYNISTKVAEVNWTEIQSVSVIVPKKKIFCFNDTKKFYLILNGTKEDLEFYESNNNITDEHMDEWAELWKSGISIEGDYELSKAVNCSNYYILSSIRDDLRLSISPGTISSPDYNGHIFWDFETFMFPFLLVFHPELAKSGLNYRIDRKNGAKIKAEKNGYKGLQYPWESAFSGEETCPTWAKSGKLEQHISGDIVFAFKQYYMMNSLSMNEIEELYEVVEGIATFFQSRVSKRNGTNFYDIIHVIPPDEYASGPSDMGVNNSVYTNAVAQISFDFAIKIAKLLGKDYPREWKEIADNLFFPYNTMLRIDLEYEDYDGEEIKQADVVLLMYPLNWGRTRFNFRNNLEYYSQKVDKNGPSMTHGIHSIEWNYFKEFEKANDYFSKAYINNTHGPWDVWTELPTGGGAINFVTGAGCFLQSIVFGFGGVRIISNKIRFSPVLIDKTNKISFNNIHYKDQYFSVSYTEKYSTITAERGRIYVCYENSRKMEFLNSINGKKTIKISNQEFFVSDKNCENVLVDPIIIMLVICFGSASLILVFFLSFVICIQFCKFLWKRKKDVNLVVNDKMQVPEKMYKRIDEEKTKLIDDK